ncbi:MAG: alpha/beta hydrolase [Acidimicrobiales bacterium]
MTVPEGLHVLDPEPDAEEVVVLVHGAMDRSASFGRMARHLDGLALVRYDRRGYGRSAALGAVDLDGHVADLLAVIGGRRSVVLGHSFGGVAALVAAVQVPDVVRAVVAYEAPSPWEPWWPGTPSGGAPVDAADEAEAFMRRAIGDRYWERLPARTRADRRAEGPALQADLRSLAGPAPYDAAAISVPTLACWGSETTWWHHRAAAELAASAPLGEEVVVAGAQHGVHLSHPTAAAGLVRRGLERSGLRALASR